MNTAIAIYPQINSVVQTYGTGGPWTGTLLAVARVNPSLAKLRMNAGAAQALDTLGDVAHAFCVVQHFIGDISLCMWSTRWQSHFARVSHVIDETSVAALGQLIDKHTEIVTLESLGLWDLEALAMTLASPRAFATSLKIVGGTDHAYS